MVTGKVTTVKAAAERLGLAPVTVRRMIAAGQVAIVRLGPRGWAVRVPEAEIDRLLAEGASR